MKLQELKGVGPKIQEKLNKNEKSSDLVVSNLVKSSLRKVMKNSIQKKPEIEVHLIRS